MTKLVHEVCDKIGVIVIGTQQSFLMDQPCILSPWPLCTPVQVAILCEAFMTMSWMHTSQNEALTKKIARLVAKSRANNDLELFRKRPAYFDIRLLTFPPKEISSQQCLVMKQTSQCFRINYRSNFINIIAQGEGGVITKAIMQPFTQRN